MTPELKQAVENAQWPSDPVERALMESDQRRSWVQGETGRDPGDVLADEVRRLREQVEFYRSRCIAGFYEEAVPEFTQGAPVHEIQEFVTADEVAGYVAFSEQLGKVQAHMLRRAVERNARIRESEALLSRAADSLQDYCAEVNGDMNDHLAMEIREFLDGRP